jgi:hypothetical protein
MKAHATTKRTRRGKNSQKKRDLLSKKHQAHLKGLKSGIKVAKTPHGKLHLFVKTLP